MPLSGHHGGRGWSVRNKQVTHANFPLFIPIAPVLVVSTLREVLPNVEYLTQVFSCSSLAAILRSILRMILPETSFQVRL